MNKKLGAFALLGASAVVLAGCAGGTGGTPSDAADGGNITVWLVGTDTPDTAREYLKSTFESENKGWTLTVEEKTWADTNETYVAALSSSDSPDVVEVGNTQALGFIDQGLFADITDMKADLGGDDLLPGLVDAGTYDGDFYAAPYYAGGRIVFYTPQIVTGAVPTTLDEYVANGIAMKTDTVSGIYAPGKDWYNALPYVWAHGGEIAVKDGDTWDAQFSSDDSVAGLSQLQEVYLKATNAPADGDEANPQVPFCAGEVGYLSAPGWVKWSILAPADDAKAPGCPDTYGKDLAAFPLPGLKAGDTAPIFAGGSNIAVAAKSANPEQAKAALKVLLSEGYQQLLAEGGLTPGIISAAQFLPQDPITQAQATALANSKFTPMSPNWSEVEKALLIPDALVKIAQGGDVKAIATDLDKQIEAILNK